MTKSEYIKVLNSEYYLHIITNQNNIKHELHAPLINNIGILAYGTKEECTQVIKDLNFRSLDSLTDNIVEGYVSSSMNTFVFLSPILSKGLFGSIFLP